MNYSRKYGVVIGALSLSLLTACGDEPPTPIAGANTSAVESTSAPRSQPVSAESLIDSATTEVEARIIEASDVELEDVIPPEYLQSGQDAPQMAVATLEPTQGHEVKGVVAIINEDEVVVDEIGQEQVVSKVRIVAEISGLTPGPHGFHVHEIGDCSASDASSAGGHLNPEDVAHGGPNDEERHAGDLGNLTASAYGVSKLDITDPYLGFAEGSSVIGRAIVVHEGQDDLSSQPSGDAGDRVACGVIESYRPDARDVSQAR